MSCTLDPDLESNMDLAYSFLVKLWTTTNQAAMSGATAVLLVFCLWVVMLFGSMSLICVLFLIYKTGKRFGDLFKKQKTE